VAVFTVDQAYRIKSNRSLLTQPALTLAGSAAVPSDTEAERIEVLCECSAPHCNATLAVLRSDYARLRPERRQLAVAVGHELESWPVRVTLNTETYELVEPWQP
jgi:hypothetical protein